MKGSLLLIWTGVLGLSGCATTEVTPKAPPRVDPPTYVQVPHPEGYSQSDLKGIFLTKDAPVIDTLKDCGQEIEKLSQLTKSENELTLGTRELIKKSPVTYHWCFYSKLLNLDEKLRGDLYLDERQKATLGTYAFLTPVAKAFLAEFRDSRYMRWAVRHYKSISELVFYRKLEVTPRMTVELVEATNPFGFARAADQAGSVIEKYRVGPVQAPPAEQAHAESGGETTPVSKDPKDKEYWDKLEPLKAEANPATEVPPVSAEAPQPDRFPAQEAAPPTTGDTDVPTPP